jgi:hypothetical protein
VCILPVMNYMPGPTIRPSVTKKILWNTTLVCRRSFAVTKNGIHVITRDIKNAWFRVKTNVPDNIMRVYCTHVCRVIGLLQAVMLRFSRARHPLAARTYVEMRLVVEAKL